MKKIIVMMLAVSLLLCACATASNETNQNIGKPLEEGSAPTGSTGAPSTNSTGVPPTQTTGPATTTVPPVTTAPPVTSAPPATTAPAVKPTQPNHTHSYTGKVTKAATCTTDGVKTYTCSCNASYTEKITAPGHVWGNWMESKIATAAEPGEQARTCNNCDAYQSQQIPTMSYDGTNYFYNKDNHTPVSGKVAVNPRCVFWNGGKLYVQAFVINGVNYTVRVNQLTSLRISNPSVQLAYATNFDNTGAVLAPGEYAIIHIVFGTDQVANYGANLNSLRFEWSLDIL